MTDRPEDNQVPEQAFGPGWEREHTTDYGDYLDALLDPTDPLHAAAIGQGELNDRPESGTRSSASDAAPYVPTPRLISELRFLPDPALIPPCPQCGDRQRVQLVVVGMPAAWPTDAEEGRVQFAGCLVNEDNPTLPWWCPSCELAYPWTYPFERTLLVREPWVSMILDGYKTWELRRSSTKVRGLVGLSPSGSGEIAGCAQLWDVHGPFTAEELDSYRQLHRVDDESVQDYATGKPLYAWEFRYARWFELPAPYEHPQGAVIWVKLPRSSAEGL